MIQTAPDVKPILPGRHPFLPRQPPAALPSMTPQMTPQVPLLAMVPTSPRYLTPVQERRIDAWRKTTSASSPSEAEHGAASPTSALHSCPDCPPSKAQSKKSKSAPASLAPKSQRSHHHPHSCHSSEGGTRSAGTSALHTASPAESRHPASPAYVNDIPSPGTSGSYGMRSYYSTKKHRTARREMRQASQSAPHPGASQPLDAASILYEEAPPHNWGAEMNYTPRDPVAVRVPASIGNKATPRIAGARDPISQKYWRAMFPPPAPGGGLM